MRARRDERRFAGHRPPQNKDLIHHVQSLRFFCTSSAKQDFVEGFANIMQLTSAVLRFFSRWVPPSKNPTCWNSAGESDPPSRCTTHALHPGILRPSDVVLVLPLEPIHRRNLQRRSAAEPVETNDQATSQWPWRKPGSWEMMGNVISVLERF